MKKRPRYQYLGWIIEKGLTGWAVFDWDYESESLAYVAASERAAQTWCEDIVHNPHPAPRTPTKEPAP